MPDRWVVNGRTGQVVTQIETGGRPRNAQISRDGRWAFPSAMGNTTPPSWSTSRQTIDWPDGSASGVAAVFGAFRPQRTSMYLRYEGNISGPGLRACAYRHVRMSW